MALSNRDGLGSRVGLGTSWLDLSTAARSATLAPVSPDTFDFGTGA